MGALSWSGFTSRRAEFTPYLNDFVHLPATYCYRCWYGESPETCGLQCAQALEDEILCLGPETVSAYIAEPVSGHSLAAAHPPDEHFRRIRQICDKYGVILIIVSLIYLAIQIRQNTSTIKAATELETGRMWSELHARVANSPDMADIWDKGLTEPDSLSATEKRRFIWFVAEYFFVVENHSFLLQNQVRIGLLFAG